MYKYGMRLRGFSVGCQPMIGLVRREGDPTGKYHDILIYNRPLDDHEQDDFELDYLGFEQTIKMMPYDEFAAEQRGREEAWELIKAIGKMSDDDMADCFGTSVIVNLSYTEAREKYEAWKKQKDELKIGDEVMHDAHGRCVLLEKKDVCEAELWSVIDEKGVVHQINRKHIHRKTGRTFPEVAELLEKMRNPDVDH